MIRIIINGKKADRPEIRSIIATIRDEGFPLEVRVTWEDGDGERFVREACTDGVPRLIAAGGDGTINEVVTGLAKLSLKKRPELAIMPLGTANDFATACAIPAAPLAALRLAVTGSPEAIDIVQANERYFVNVASGGFGAEVSADTPVQLKNFFGGGAYALSAVIKSLSFRHNQGSLIAKDVELKGAALIAAVCNGRQAGGGQILAANAYINDGLLDVFLILSFPLTNINQVLQEVLNVSENGQYVKRFQTPWLLATPEATRSVNLDGEPYQTDTIRFEVIPKAIQLILPNDCPCILK